MAKKAGFDPIADAHELSEHNINPYYWVNRVNSYTFARWMSQKKFAIIFAPIYVLMLILMIQNLQSALDDGNGLSQIAFLLLFGFITIAYVIMASQSLFARRQEPNPSEVRPKRKKKLPKRRKDYH